MKLTATIARSLQADMQAELRDLERAVATGTRDAGRGLKTELRRQVASAGLGQRLAAEGRNPAGSAATTACPAPEASPEPTDDSAPTESTP